MYAYFSVDRTHIAATTSFLHRIMPNTKPDQIVLFLKRSREFFFPLSHSIDGGFFSPLPPQIFNAILIDPRCEFFHTSMTEDWLISLINAMTPAGLLIMANPTAIRDAVPNRLPFERCIALLGEPTVIDANWISFRRPSKRPEEHLSILGAYQAARGDIILAMLEGSTIWDADPGRLRAYLGPMVDRTPNLKATRIARSALVDIVRRYRSGEAAADHSAIPLPLAPARSQPLEQSADRLAGIMKSWNSYLIPGTYYKASTLGVLLRRFFDNSRPLHLLEHGGNAGALSLQLLMEPDLNIQSVRCCEIGAEVLVCARELSRRLGSRVQGRFTMEIVSAEDVEYGQTYDVIVFLHVTIYLRRDLLRNTLSKAFQALNSGGAIIILEITKPPTSSGGPDDDIIFAPGELDEILAEVGKVEYFDTLTARPVDKAAREVAPCFRVIRRHD